jgi:transcriptional regulator with XRE-family HTH domain
MDDMTPKLEKKPVPVELRAFSKNIKLSRLHANKTQKDIETETGLSRPYLSDVERMVSSVSVDTMGLMAQAVNVPLYYLLMPDFQTVYDFEEKEIWLNYKQSIDNSNDIVYERKLFAKNLKHLRESQCLRKYELEELTGSNSELFTALERASININLDTAINVAHGLMTPLYLMLKP